MKLNKAKRDKLEKGFKRGTMTTEIKEDGSVFFFEDERHKERLEKREARRNERREERKAERIAARKEARKANG